MKDSPRPSNPPPSLSRALDKGEEGGLRLDLRQWCGMGLGVLVVALLGGGFCGRGV
ncbi:uncharacterized protein BO80DRAFT_420837 [Aspergillus ibericus CBS 121593]|uniref:Uncharacterized protein n=1 Tax=Aspergillus ibericus CBS 121593 TaxID=1448316 RepID=A0A395HDT5_9EURO|nr:hypothetical protein BO80DRAFT_420837 [Aspergillus ibericus CBS 121593]RAL05633.1 hypothetical protein BO80DRAFT_420837 [Aspergillus ibericus CBS 121593]